MCDVLCSHHEPDGEFLSQSVPELRPLPVKYLDRPAKTPLPAQEEHGVVIGAEYPYPAIDDEAPPQRAMDRYERLKPRACETLEQPEIVRGPRLTPAGIVNRNEFRRTVLTIGHIYEP